MPLYFVNWYRNIVLSWTQCKCSMQARCVCDKRGDHSCWVGLSLLGKKTSLIQYPSMWCWSMYYSTGCVWISKIAICFGCFNFRYIPPSVIKLSGRFTGEHTWRKPHLIFAQTWSCPIIFVETGCLTVYGHPCVATVLKKCLHPTPIENSWTRPWELFTIYMFFKEAWIPIQR